MPQPGRMSSIPYDLWVGKMPSLFSKLRRRDAAPFIDFNHNIPAPGSWDIPLGQDGSMTLDCHNCGTHGGFDLEVHVADPYLFDPTASMILTAQGVSANITPKLGLTANFTKSYSDNIPAGTITLVIPNIPGVFDVGPQISLFTWDTRSGPSRVPPKYLGAYPSAYRIIRMWMLEFCRLALPLLAGLPR